MDISYDIFDLTDFPIIITDGDFIIKYKNRLASKLFGKLRKGSKITRYLRNFKKDIDFFNICELDIETGTQFMRALIMPLNNEAFAFLFFTVYAFTDFSKLSEFANNNFGENLLDLYCNAYRQYKSSEGSAGKEKSNVPERTISELMAMTSLLFEKPDFMQTELFDIADIMLQISSKISSKLSVLGLKSALAEIPESENGCCFAKINPRHFSFIIFRMIYTAFKLSDTGKIRIFFEEGKYSDINICISTQSSLNPELEDICDFSYLINALPEFSFEFHLLKKMGVLGNSLFFSFNNSILKLHYKLKRETGCNFILRSEPAEIRKRRIEKIISEALLKTKKMLSKKDSH